MRHGWEDLGCRDAARHQGGHPAKRGLLLGQGTELVAACLGFLPAFFCIRGTRSCDAGQEVRDQRDHDEDEDDHPVLNLGHHPVDMGPTAEVVIRDGTHHRRGGRESGAPARCDDQDADQVKHAKSAAGVERLQQERDGGLHHKAANGHRQPQQGG